MPTGPGAPFGLPTGEPDAKATCRRLPHRPGDAQACGFFALRREYATPMQLANRSGERKKRKTARHPAPSQKAERGATSCASCWPSSERRNRGSDRTRARAGAIPGRRVSALFVENLSLLGYATCFAREFDPESGEARALSVPALEQSMRPKRLARTGAQRGGRQTFVALSFRVSAARSTSSTHRKAGRDIVMLASSPGQPLSAPAAPIPAAVSSPLLRSFRVVRTRARYCPRLSEAARHALASQRPRVRARIRVAAAATARPPAWYAGDGASRHSSAVARYPLHLRRVARLRPRDAARATDLQRRQGLSSGARSD